MVQRMTDSAFSGYNRLPNNEFGSGNQDKQPILPVTAKKTPLRDLQNEIRTTVPIIRESSLFPKESGPTIEASKACSTKRPTPECLVSPPNFKSLTSSAPNAPLVYVRRRPDTELAKSSISDNTSNNAHFPQEERKLAGNDERTEQKSHVKEPKVCAPEVAPITRASLTCFSSGKPSVSPPEDSNNRTTYSAIPRLNYPKEMHSQHWEERYCHLRDLLKVLNQSNQEDYMQMLRSLSPVELNRYAVELEKRSIELSLEEAKEIQRVRLFNVLGKYPKISRAP